MEDDLDSLERRFKARFSADEPFVLKLLNNASTGEKTKIARLQRVAQNGLASVTSRCKPSGQAEIVQLVREFAELGCRAFLNTGAQRGGDFLNNQLQGRWAENVVLSMKLPQIILLPFGPSGAAMPGEEDYRKVVTTYRLIALLEGKRPDLLAFDAANWDAFSDQEKAQIADWSMRPLLPADETLLKKAKFAVEVKNSSFHYETRRQHGGGPLSIPAKVEEIPFLQNWQQRTGVPLVFILVTFDELYCMSFPRMLEAIDRRCVYVEGDYILDASTGASGPNESTGKVYHRFLLQDFRHRCGSVVFPDQSDAMLPILKDGHVVPYLNLKPVQAKDVQPDVVLREAAYRTAQAN